MRSETFQFNTSDRVSLFVHKWEPDAATRARAPKRAVVHIAHGLAEHGGRYAHVAEALTQAGYVTYANDHRGHGRTAGEAEDLGFFASSGGWDRVIDDLRQLIELEKKLHPGLPLVLVGHSMGSLMAQHMVARHPEAVSALVLSGPSGKPTPLAAAGKLIARVERRRLGERGRSSIINSMSFDAFNKAIKSPRTKFDWLTRDGSEVDKYVADPRCGFVCSTALWVDLLDAIAKSAGPAGYASIRKDLPIYLIAGAEDPVSERTKTLVGLLQAFKDAGLYRVTHRFYAGARHELFNEVNRGEVIADLLTWLNKNI